jgi:hypothetical protein
MQGDLGLDRGTVKRGFLIGSQQLSVPPGPLHERPGYWLLLADHSLKLIGRERRHEVVPRAAKDNHSTQR